MEDQRAKRVDFEAAALKSLDGKPWGALAIFECPLCGCQAGAIRDHDNGKLLAECAGCKMLVAETESMRIKN